MEDVVDQLQTTPETGLSSGEADARLESNGPNTLREQKRKSVFAILVNQFQGVIVWLLLFAAGLSFAFGELAEGIAIVVLLLINAGIGFVTELRAVRSMEALKHIADVQTRVRRDGEDQ